MFWAINLSYAMTGDILFIYVGDNSVAQRLSYNLRELYETSLIVLHFVKVSIFCSAYDPLSITFFKPTCVDDCKLSIYIEILLWEIILVPTFLHLLQIHAQPSHKNIITTIFYNKKSNFLP